MNTVSHVSGRENVLEYLENPQTQISAEHRALVKLLVGVVDPNEINQTVSVQETDVGDVYSLNVLGCNITIGPKAEKIILSDAAFDRLTEILENPESAPNPALVDLLRRRPRWAADAPPATLPGLLDKATFAQIAAVIDEGYKAGAVFHGQEVDYLLRHPGLITKVQIAFNEVSEGILDILLTTEFENIYLTHTRPDNVVVLRERESTISKQNGRNLTHMDMVRSVTHAVYELFRLQHGGVVEGRLLSIQERLDLIHENDIGTRGAVQTFFEKYYSDPTQFGADFFTVNTLDLGKKVLPLNKDGMQFLPDFLDKHNVPHLTVI